MSKNVAKVTPQLVSSKTCLNEFLNKVFNPNAAIALIMLLGCEFKNLHDETDNKTLHTISLLKDLKKHLLSQSPNKTYVALLYVIMIEL